MVDQAERPFRIIVVGSGVAGIVVSNAPQRLSVDHVLGYLPAIQKASVPISRFCSRDPTGRLIHDNLLYTQVEKNHGIGFYPLERQNLLQILYDGLPDKSFIRTNSGVEDVAQFTDRVEVKLKDGSVEVGDMVLGCDGVHSHMRTLSLQHAGKTSPGLIPNTEKTSLKTSWKTLAMTTPPMPGLGDSCLTVTYNNGITFLATSQPHAVYFFIIFALDKPFTWPHRERHTDEEAQLLAETIMNKSVTQELLFGEVWRRRTRAVVISLEECVMDHWHHGRNVLDGDAVHKVHPNMALGGNPAIEGVTRVINHIHNIMQTTKGPKPMREPMDIRNMVAKMHTYATPIHMLLANWILPISNDRLFADHMGGYLSAGPKLNPSIGFTNGLMEWKEKPDDYDKNSSLKNEIRNTTTISELSISAKNALPVDSTAALGRY
ncbi:FAD binding domain protein [Trichoderma compactum]